MQRVFVLTVLLALAGCSEEGKQPEIPSLHPASGAVLQNGQPVSGGVVRFTPAPDPGEFLINSEVGSDGRFTLSTVRATDSKGVRMPGAPAGSFRVTYMPVVRDQTAGNLDPIVLPKPIVIEPQHNDLKIELPRR